MTPEEKKKKKELKHWENEKKYIPMMVRIYCHGHHHTHGKEVCPDCQALTEYCLYRLSLCPFKVNKQFCSFCKIHCYTPENRAKIKDVMRYSGPRMLFHRPIFACGHMVRTMKAIRAKKKEEKKKTA